MVSLWFLFNVMAFSLLTTFWYYIYELKEIEIVCVGGCGEGLPPQKWRFWQRHHFSGKSFNCYFLFCSGSLNYLPCTCNIIPNIAICRCPSTGLRLKGNRGHSTSACCLINHTVIHANPLITTHLFINANLVNFGFIWRCPYPRIRWWRSECSRTFA